MSTGPECSADPGPGGSGGEETLTPQARQSDDGPPPDGQTDELGPASPGVAGDTEAGDAAADTQGANVDAEGPAQRTEPGGGDVLDVMSAPLEGDNLRGALEAILLIIDEPVSSTMLASVLGVPLGVVAGALDDLRGEYDRAGRGFELRRIGDGWRLYTRADYAPYVERFVLDGQQARLTQAALETLAVVAYRQPVTRSRVGAVRGVNVDGVMRTLTSRGLVEEAGTEPETGAVMYRTTAYFLERLGLRELGELPSLADFLPESTTIEELEGELSREG